MSNDSRPVWLLDVDGVINVITHGFPNTYPEDTWRSFQFTPPKWYSSLTIRYSTFVIDFIKAMSEWVDIRWQTTWGQLANEKLCEETGLPEFVVAPNPNVPSKDYSWWKLDNAVNVAVVEKRDLIWTDDELGRSAQSEFQKAVTSFLGSYTPSD